jgi:hypothetical protein
MRRWWLTLVLNSVAILALWMGCARNERLPALSLLAPPDTVPAPENIASDKRSPTERQDYWWWPPPDVRYGVPTHYVLEYQKWGETKWKRLGVCVQNAGATPQRYRPCRVRAVAYFERRVWMEGQPPGYGPRSAPSAWRMPPKTGDVPERNEDSGT